MMNKRYIYPMLLFAVFYCLTVGLSGCISGNEDEYCGKTPVREPAFLTVTTRGIETDVPEDGKWDNYVNSIRLIGFKDGEAPPSFNIVFTNGGDNKWTLVSATEIVINTEIQAGQYAFYFIANEGGHTLAGENNILLKNKLDAISSQDELKGLTITYQAPEPEKPMLMTAVDNRMIWGGTTNNISVELIRTLSKLAGVQVVDKDDASCEGSFTLKLTGGNKFGLFVKTALGGTDYNKPKEIEGELATGPFLENDDTADLTGYYFTESSKIELVEVQLSDGTESSPKEKEVITVENRNTRVGVRAKLSEQEQCLQINTLIAPWAPISLSPGYE